MKIWVVEILDRCDFNRVLKRMAFANETSADRWGRSASQSLLEKKSKEDREYFDPQPDKTEMELEN